MPSLADAQAAGAPTINYGLFFNSIIDFVIIAFVIFMVVRTANTMKKKEVAARRSASTIQSGKIARRDSRPFEEEITETLFLDRASCRLSSTIFSKGKLQHVIAYRKSPGYYRRIGRIHEGNGLQNQ